MSENLIPLVVTTTHRAVFFGYGLPTTEKIIRIERARMAVSWTASIRGVTGLAAVGPDKTCKIAFSVPAITLQDVTSVMECSPEAAEKWEEQPW